MTDRASNNIVQSWSVKQFLASSFLAIVLLCSTDSLSATIVYLKDSDEPIAGYLIRIDENQVQLRVTNSLGDERVATFFRADIDRILNPLNEERLETLDPSVPLAYFEYAEEMAAKKIDPEAIDLAMRLYVIAAYHGDEAIRSSAFLGLISLARSEQEEKTFRSVAFQSDPARNRTLLVEPNRTDSPVTRLTEDQRDESIDAIRLLRTGYGRRALDLSQRPGVEAVFNLFPSLMTLDAFQSACSQDELSPETLAALIEFELAILEFDRSASGINDFSTTRNHSWGQTILLAPSPLHITGLTDMCEFDPRVCIYRDGAWRRP